jgi:hypothetical protein
MPKFESFDVSINIPLIGSVSGTWKPNDAEKKAAWEMYVELVTRISVVELKDNEGILRESLDSLYSLFKTTRDILKKYGPDVAISRKKNELSFGKLAVLILNYQIRPVLATWHPLLKDYEGQRKKGVSIIAHEKEWEYHDELRETLNETRGQLIHYSIFLAKVANVSPLYEKKSEIT